MSTKKFKELIETENYQRIIGLYTHLKINLTNQQLDRVLRLKRRKEAELWGRKLKQREF